MSYTKYIEDQIKNIALNEEIHIFTTRTARELYPIIYKISKRKTQKLLIKEKPDFIVSLIATGLSPNTSSAFLKTDVHSVISINLN